MGYVFIYLAAVVIFLGIDAVWLTTMKGAFYESRIGHLLADEPNMMAAGVFYMFYILALCIIRKSKLAHPLVISSYSAG